MADMRLERQVLREMVKRTARERRTSYLAMMREMGLAKTIFDNNKGGSGLSLSTIYKVCESAGVKPWRFFYALDKIREGNDG